MLDKGYLLRSYSTTTAHIGWELREANYDFESFCPFRFYQSFYRPMVIFTLMECKLIKFLDYG